MAQPFSLPSDTFIATLCHVTSLCVLELGARKWVAAWTFIVGPLQFNLGNAGTIVCKDFHALLVFFVFFFFLNWRVRDFKSFSPIALCSPSLLSTLKIFCSVQQIFC